MMNNPVIRNTIKRFIHSMKGWMKKYLTLDSLRSRWQIHVTGSLTFVLINGHKIVTDRIDSKCLQEREYSLDDRGMIAF